MRALFRTFGARLPLSVLLWGRSLDRNRRTATYTAASAASTFATGSLLQCAADGALCFLLRRIWSRRPFRLRRLRSAAALLLPWLRLLLRTFALALPLLAIPPRPALVARPVVGAIALTLGASAALFLAAHLPGSLLVLADFLLHETPRLLVEF